MLRAAVAVGCLTLSSAAQAQAQQMGTGTPTTPLSPVVAAIPSSDVGPPSADALSLPTRLSLLSTVVPRGFSPGPTGCGAESVEAAGTVFSTQLGTQVQWTPRLVLFGFSDLGCPGDRHALLNAGAGGGFTYTVPVRPGLWLATSGGTYLQPGYGSVPATAAVAGGLDLMRKTSGGRTVSTGVGVVAAGRGARAMVRTGGSF